MLELAVAEPADAAATRRRAPDAAALGLLDGGPASVSSLTRERAVLLAIDRELFATLYGASRARSRGFAAAVQADLISSLEIATRSLSHVATNAWA